MNTPRFLRMRLRRADGAIYLDRWGIAWDPVGRVLLHRMDAPDPGIDLHDHPWWFASIVLKGGYTEQRSPIRTASLAAKCAESCPKTSDHYIDLRGERNTRRRLSIRTLRLDECHTITALHGATCWTLVIGGPRRRGWGFYTPDGYLDEKTYDETVRVERRDLWNEVGT